MSESPIVITDAPEANSTKKTLLRTAVLGAAALAVTALVVNKVKKANISVEAGAETTD